eukprot:TRINITY_DN13419_c0_g1_i2.p1 TRINITY_DN13419_c0_g1~~TRINITY_DN13419_c0_g1_i2.p1  ORF type:complete len:604 (+),score=100.08 TRINITY_DN13419_c0_g1_i2:25-1812(+)
MEKGSASASASASGSAQSSAEYPRHALGWHHYKALGVHVDATQDQIKSSYKKLALIYHPDKNPGQEEKFKRISEAYACLSDTEKREKYDLLGDGTYQKTVEKQQSAKIEVSREEVVQEWSIYYAFLAGTLLVDYLVGMKVEWLIGSVLLGYFGYKQRLTQMDYMLIGGVVFCSILLTILLSPKLASVLGSVSVYTMGIALQNRLTVQIDLSVVSWCLMVALVLFLVPMHTLGYFLGCFMFCSGLALIYRQKKQYALIFELLYVHPSLVLKCRELLFPVISVVVWVPILLWNVGLVQTGVFRASLLHIEWLPLPFIYLVAWIEMLCYAEYQSFLKTFIPVVVSTTCIYLITPSQYLPILISFTLNIGLLMNLNKFFPLVDKIMASLELDQKFTSINQNIWKILLIASNLLVFGLLTFVDMYFNEPQFWGIDITLKKSLKKSTNTQTLPNQPQTPRSITFMWIDLGIYGLLTAHLFVLYSLNYLPPSFSHIREVYLSLKRKILDFLYDPRDRDSSSSVGGFFYSAPKIHINLTATNKSKPKDKTDPTYKSARQEKRDAIRDAARAQKKTQKEKEEKKAPRKKVPLKPSFVNTNKNDN